MFLSKFSNTYIFVCVSDHLFVSVRREKSLSPSVSWANDFSAQ